MATPRRVQRRRTPGWRMPVGAVYVGRPGTWGNPWPVGQPGPDGHVAADRADAAERHQAWTATQPASWRHAVRRALAGRDLACWCPLDQPCHADTLLAIANTNAEVI